jgi:hypothetical protein
VLASLFLLPPKKPRTRRGFFVSQAAPGVLAETRFRLIATTRPGRTGAQAQSLHQWTGEATNHCRLGDTYQQVAGMESGKAWGHGNAAPGQHPQRLPVKGIIRSGTNGRLPDAQGALNTPEATKPTGKAVRPSSTSASRPTSTNSTAFRISSSNYQNMSRYWRVISDMANCRLWLPTIRPATTMASGPEVCSVAARAMPPITRASVRLQGGAGRKCLRGVNKEQEGKIRTRAKCSAAKRNN